MADDFSNDSFGVLPEIRIEKIIILAWTVKARGQGGRVRRGIRIAEGRRGAVVGYKNFRMLLI